MISITCIHTIFRLNPSQNLRQPVRIFQCLIFVVKNISGNHDQIRILCIDLLHHLLHLPAANVISQMKICNQHHIQRIQFPGFLINRNIILCRLYISRINHSINTDRRNDHRTDYTHNSSPHISEKQRSSRKIQVLQRIFQQQSQHICDSHSHDCIHQHSKPVITQKLHKSPKSRRRCHKRDQNTEDNKQIDKSDPSAHPHILKNSMQHLYPVQTSQKNINTHQQINRCQIYCYHIILSPY